MLSVLPAVTEKEQSKLQPLDLQTTPTAWILLQLSSPPSLILIYQVRYKQEEYRTCETTWKVGSFGHSSSRELVMN